MNFAVAVGKLVRSAIRVFRRGGGSAFPGLLASKLDPKLLERSISGVPHGVVAVSGSAGKSSTTKMLTEIFEAHGLRVFTNPSTANIRQGLFSAIVAQAGLSGKIAADVVVFELDEGHGAELAPMLKPKLSVITNVMSDQLDRFIDPKFVIEKLQIIAEHSGVVVANADDANLAFISNGVWFGSAPALRARSDYPEYAITFNRQLAKPQLTVTSMADRNMEADWVEGQINASLPGTGMHTALNAAAAWLAAATLLGEGFDADLTSRVLSKMEPVFARDETVLVRGKKVRLMLVQNPGSFRMNIRNIGRQPQRLFIGIGRDVHDPSWLWGVDFSVFERVDMVAGFNAHELALRLTYNRVPFIDAESSVPEAVDKFLDESDSDDIVMLVTADVMRRARRHLELAK